MFGKTDSIWIEGEGMLHAIYFTKDGEGNWTICYNNRFVETETYKMERERNRPCFLPTVAGDPPAALASAFLNMVDTKQDEKFHIKPSEYNFTTDIVH